MAGRSECSQRAAQAVAIALSPMSALERITDLTSDNGPCPTSASSGRIRCSKQGYRPNIGRSRSVACCEGLIRTMWQMHGWSAAKLSGNRHGNLVN